MNFKIESFEDIDEALEVRTCLNDKLEILEERALSDITPVLADILAKRIEVISRALKSIQEAINDTNL